VLDSIFSQFEFHSFRFGFHEMGDSTLRISCVFKHSITESGLSNTIFFSETNTALLCSERLKVS